MSSSSSLILKGASWSDIKDALAVEYDWLAAFRTSFDGRISEHMHDVDLTPPRYEPQLWDKHLWEASRLIDRCLTGRLAYMELEGAAVSQALALNREVDLREVDQELDKVPYSLSKDRNIASEEAEAKAAMSFTRSGHPLGLGLAATADGTAKVSRLTVTSAGESVDLLTKQYEERKALSEAIKERYYQEGSALNFKERADAIMKDVLTDFGEAYEKCFSASLGIAAFGPSIEALPSKDSTGLFDSLVHWTRGAMRALDIVLAQEYQYCMSFSLTDSYRGTTLVPSLDAAYAGAADWGSIDILVPKDWFGDFASVRLAGVGMTYEPADGDHGEASFRASIRTPRQEVPGVAPYVRPALMLGDVQADASPIGPSFASGPAIRNLHPSGAWNLKVARFGSLGPMKRPKRLVMHLLLRIITKEAV